MQRLSGKQGEGTVTRGQACEPLPSPAEQAFWADPPKERQAKVTDMVSDSLLLRSNEGKMQRLGAGFPHDFGFHFIKEKVSYSPG